MRTKRTILNFITDTLPQIIIACLGIYKMSLFLKILGNEQLGLYQLFSQIVAYLVLVEGGVGSATLFRLYKPIKDNNKEEINIITRTSKYLFNIICFLIIIFGIILAINITIFIKDTTISIKFIQLIFTIYLISQTIYYFTVTERTVFDANQRRYVTNTIFQLMNIVKTIVEITVVLLGGNLLFIVISLLLNSAISNLLVKVFYRKDYGKIDIKGKKDFSILGDVKHLFVNTLGNLVANNIDIIIISKFIGISSVVIYSSYNYIVENLRQIIEKITGSTMSSIADVILEDKEKAYKIFLEFSSFTFFLALVICIPLLFAINPFIKIVYDNQIVITNLLAILFTLSLFYQIISIPLKVYTLSSGFFKEVKIFVIIQCIINITLSLIFVHIIGIPGVLIATLISYLIADYIPKIIIIHKKLFNKSYKNYLWKISIYIIISLILYFSILLLKFEISDLFIWFIMSTLIFIINLFIILAIFWLLKDLSFLERFNIKKIFRRNNL